MNNLLNDYPVVIEIPVAWGEMDVLNHVNNIYYFRYFENARVAYFEKMGLGDFLTKSGMGPIMASTSCKFKIPLSYPDRVLVGAKVDGIETDRFLMKYVVVSRKHRKVAAEGDGLIVTINYGDGKRVAVPDFVKQRILEVEKSAFASDSRTDF